MTKPGEKFKWGRQAVTYAREAAKTVRLDQIRSWDELNRSITELAKEKKSGTLAEDIREQWQDLAVHGVFMFDREANARVFKPMTDLDGKCAVGLLALAGINTENLTYVEPGKSKPGAVNLDTGDKFGAVFDEETESLFMDHHEKGALDVSSAAEVVYKTLVGLRMLKKEPALDRLVEFVTKVDNRQLPNEEFLRSAKTIIGLQRAMDFEKLHAFFQDHENSTDELTPEEFKSYGLQEDAQRQQDTVDQAMEKLSEMEAQGKVIETQYGKVLINTNNELKVGASAAYVKFDGIINITPGKSFAVLFKEKELDEEQIQNKLGARFQGKIIRGKMWIYNNPEPLKLEVEDLIQALQ